MDESTPYVLVDEHMVDTILITNHKVEFRAWAKEINEGMDLAHRGYLCFDGKELYFDDEEDDLLDDSDDIFMVENRGSLYYL